MRSEKVKDAIGYMYKSSSKQIFSIFELKLLWCVLQIGKGLGVREELSQGLK